jgi:hypothetical protein
MTSPRRIKRSGKFFIRFTGIWVDNGCDEGIGKASASGPAGMKNTPPCPDAGYHTGKEDTFFCKNEIKEMVAISR